MFRKPSEHHAHIKDKLRSMVERKDLAGFFLTLFFVAVVKSLLMLTKAIFGLIKKMVRLATATTHTAMFAVQLSVARHRAMRVDEAHIRWFGRATIMRAADILVFARYWPLRPNTFVAQRVLKIAGDAAIVGLQAGDMTAEEARTWLAQIKRQVMPWQVQLAEDILVIEMPGEVSRHLKHKPEVVQNKQKAS